MNKVYVVLACGGDYDESYEAIVKIFADKDKAELFKERFLNSPELNSDYDCLYAAYVVEYDVE